MRYSKKKLYGVVGGLEIYNSTLPIIFGSKKVLKEYMKANKFDCDEDNSGYSGFVYCDDHKTPDFIYLGESLKNHSTITHEVLHYCLWVLGTRGVNIKMDDFDFHEPLTYAVGYVLEKIYGCDYWAEWDGKNFTVPKDKKK